MDLPEPTGGDFKNLESGVYLAVCYRFLDLGTQHTEYKGQPKEQHKVLIGWETPEETFTDTETGEVRPLVINKKYTWSMSENANLRKDLESWRGQPFQKGDFGPGGFNTKKLLGVPCMLTVVRAEGNNGKEYSNITGIGPIMKSLKGKVPALRNTVQYLSLNHTEFDRELFNILHDKLKEQIALSPEYMSLFGDGPKAQAMNKANSSYNQQSTGGAQTQRQARQELDDEIPF